MRKKGQQPLENHSDSRQAGDRRRDRVLAGAFAAGVHGIVLVALFWPKAGAPPSPPESSLTLVSLDVSKPPGPPNPASAESDARNEFVPPPTPTQVRAPVFSVASNSDLLSEAQIAGAANAGEGAGGGGGGSCDMARAVQRALRRDPLVRMAVQNANRQGKAIMMWNGDWVRSGAQEGKGLSAVREAIIWEVAFAPESCRNAPMRGLVLMSLAESGGDSGTRFAIGAGAWRWSDLLGLRRTVR